MAVIIINSSIFVYVYCGSLLIAFLVIFILSLTIYYKEVMTDSKEWLPTISMVIGDVFPLGSIFKIIVSFATGNHRMN